MESKNGTDDLRPRFLDEFVSEATEHLDAAEAALVAFDSLGFNAAGQAEIMRSMHAIKGASGYLALTVIQELAHATETAVQRLDRTSPADTDRLEVLFEAFDALRALLAHPSDSAGVPPALLAELRAGPEEAQAPQAAATRTIESALENVVRQQCKALAAAAARFAVEDGDAMALEMLRRVIATVRSAATYADDSGLLGAIESSEQTSVDNAARCEALRHELERVLALPQSVDRSSPENPVMARQPRRLPDQAPPAFNGQFLRVRSGRVDDLVNQAGELLTLRNQLQHFLRSLEEEGCAEHLCRAGKALAFGLGKAVDEFQSVALELRLVQLSVIFQRLPRVARDVALRSGRQMLLRTEGGETEIDKGVAEVIADPLVHMLRNAVDHGIEVPEDRERAGKDREGHVVVRAAREGNDILISVSDDGRGVNPDAVRAKAVANGLLTEAAAAELTTEGIHELLFSPGFSTAATVTEISGRGVGLDVVRANVRRVGGEVRIRSEIGRGTSVEMRLPIRVSARDVLLVQAAEEWYAIPLESVRRTLSIPSQGLHSIAQQPAFFSQDSLVPLISLAGLLGLVNNRDVPERLEVVEIASRGQSGALVVEMIGQRHQVTVKALDSSLASQGVAGATVLADGRVVLVVDPEPLMSAMAVAG